MPDRSSNSKFRCSCGRPSGVTLRMGRVSMLQFGDWPCRRHYADMVDQRLRGADPDLNKYLGYFTAEWPGWPGEGMVRIARRKAREGKPL